jgi:predicted short-subunit dehydrogenase-like oxidoreductase (DUF2520 family)
MVRNRTIVLVGKGRLGKALANSLRGHAHLRTTGGRVLAQHPKRLTQTSCTWILAVRDGALDGLVRAIAPVLVPGDVVLHLAGALGPEVLRPAQHSKASIGSFHPNFAVAENHPSAQVRLTGFLFEGDRAALSEARRIAKLTGSRVAVATHVDRARYHGAAALMATGAVALAQGATALFSTAFTPPPNEAWIRAATSSLLASVASNVARVGAFNALASPLMRDDTDTVARHLNAMNTTPEARALYKAALAVVLETLETHKTVRPETIQTARTLLQT